MKRLQRGAIFKNVERTKVNFSTFDLSNESKLTCKMGKLVPFMTCEMLPGDRFRWNTNVFARLAPMVNPIMHRMDVRYSFFFVPYRILWKHWPEFRAEGNGDVLAKDRADYQAPEHPYFPLGDFIYDSSHGNRKYFSPGSLSDYLGFPARQVLKSRFDFTYNASSRNCKLAGSYPFSVAAYAAIYDNYFRNQLLEKSFATCINERFGNLVPEGYYLCDGNNRDPLAVILDDDWSASDGIANRVVTTNGGLCPANLEHDYYTAATYAPQLGEAVELPIVTGESTVMHIPNLLVGTVRDPHEASYIYAGNNETIHDSTKQFGAVTNLYTLDGPFNQLYFRTFYTDQSSNVVQTSSHQMYARGQDVEVPFDVNANITIRDFRALQALQRYREKLLAFGTRYQEWLQGTYLVWDGDSRLDKPEYIGSYSQPVQISEVLQTSSTTDEPSPLGDYAGRGVSAGQCRTFSYQAPEDGLIMGILQITPRTGYMTGVPHSFLRESPYDYHNPFFEHIGEQEVYASELFLANDTVDASNEGDLKGPIFGYNPRYAEYKYRPDEIHGDFLTDGMLSWHLARDFSSVPKMDASFFHAINNERIFAVTDEEYDKFFVQIFTKLIANRPMTQFSTPY